VRHSLIGTVKAVKALLGLTYKSLSVTESFLRKTNVLASKHNINVRSSLT